jgi:hypothetical protein
VNSFNGSIHHIAANCHLPEPQARVAQIRALYEWRVFRPEPNTGTKDGKPFEEFKIAEEYAPKLVGAVVIRDRNPHTYGDDVRQMPERRLTFDEAIRNADFSLVSKQRLTIVRREFFEQRDKLAIS